MNRKELQKGSAHLIIVIVLAVALVGTLGYIFWQNFTNESSKKKVQTEQAKDSADVKGSENNSNNVNQDEVKLTEIAADNLGGTNLAIKYPKDWTVTHEENTVSDAGVLIFRESYSISSPDNSLAVRFFLTNGGRGGTCDDEPGRTITQLDKSAIPGYSDVFFVSYSDDQGIFFAGAMNNTEAAQAVEIGDSSCSMVAFKQLSGMVGINNPKSTNTTTMDLSIGFNKITTRGSDATQKFRQELNTENYKTAKRIIESLHVKD